MDKIKTIMSVFLILLLGLLVAGCTTTYTQEELNTQLEKVETKMESKITDINEKTTKKIENLNSEIKEKRTEIDELKEKLNEKENTNTKLQNELVKKQEEKNEALTKLKEMEEKEITETELIQTQYTKDELKLDGMYDLDLTDRKIEKLFDGEIEFDNDKYDAEEYIELTDFVVAINENDYKENVYMTFPEKGFKYTYTTSDELNKTEITKDEPLKLEILGIETELTEWTGNEIKLTSGQESLVKEGEEITFGEKTLQIKFIGENDIFVVSGEETEKIEESETEEINGFDVFVESVMENDDGPDFAKIKIGKDVEETIENGDEYAEDSMWDWVIKDNSIGLELNTDFESIDNDEEYQALGYNEGLCLPNKYVCVKFNELTEEDVEEYTFETREKDEIDYIKIKGLFTYDLEDYDIVYANQTGFFDDDFEMITDNTNKLQMGDTDVSLGMNSNGLLFDDIYLSGDVKTMEVNGTDITEMDDNYRNKYGIIIKTPEDSLEDQDVSVTIPEEKLEASISVY